MRRLTALLTLFVIALPMGACIEAENPRPLHVIESTLAPELRVARALQIRDTARRGEVINGLLLAGIANVETGMAHCWSEATWACQGPYSEDCQGPVIAGAGDGPCEDQQGGLGVFQFDAGTYSETLEREGDRVLDIQGNVDAAIDFVVAMTIRSEYIEGIETEREAIDWLNRVRPWNSLFDPWIKTVTHYYNGCVPGRCSVYESRFQNYSSKTIDLVSEMGPQFWYGYHPSCGVIPAEGGTLEETSLCFGAGGNPRYWREVSESGSENSLLWTHTTDNEDASNFAIWTIHVERAGSYLVEVYTDATWAESERAPYFVHHDEKVDELGLDQTAVDGFQEIGIFDFDSENPAWIRTNDNTGESNDLERALVVDAIRVTPMNVETLNNETAPDRDGPDESTESSENESSAMNATPSDPASGQSSVRTETTCSFGAARVPAEGPLGLLFSVSVLVGALRRRKM